MAGLAQLFAGANFQATIQGYCNEHGWSISRLNEKRALLRFEMESGCDQTLYIIKYDTTLEFSVPSALEFESVDALPHYYSSLMLKRSCERKIGFWCIEEISGKQVYSCMHNAELQLIDSAYFASVVRALILECHEFEMVVANLLK